MSMDYEIGADMDTAVPLEDEVSSDEEEGEAMYNGASGVIAKKKPEKAKWTTEEVSELVAKY